MTDELSRSSKSREAAETRRSPPRQQKVRFSFMRIMTGSDLSRRRLPVMFARTDQEGPVIWLTACAHGDEVGGIVVIQEIFRTLRKHPLRCGGVHAFPMMNPLGFETASRHIMLSEEDLNRSFPGRENGSLAERMAETIFTSIVETKPDAVIDLHNDWIKSIPYVVLDPPPERGCMEIFERARLLAGHTGYLLVGETKPLEKSLSFSLARRGIAALTIELGESYIVNEMNVQLGVRAIWKVLEFLEMVEPRPFSADAHVPEDLAGRLLTYCDQPVASASGIIRFLVRPGARVTAGQPVAKIYNAFGKLQETIRAEHDAVVLGHADSATAFPGAPVMAFANL